MRPSRAIGNASVEHGRDEKGTGGAESTHATPIGHHIDPTAQALGFSVMLHRLPSR